jgi:hypothetical protein
MRDAQLAAEMLQQAILTSKLSSQSVVLPGTAPWWIKDFSCFKASTTIF